MRRSRDQHRQEGQASVELVAAIPVLLAILLALVQLGLIGYALWSAGAAARAGARAAFVGGHAQAAARSAVPDALEHGATVRDRSGAIEVTVSAPALLPGLPRIPLRASAGFDATGDG
jgi:TadE-like protein